MTHIASIPPELLPSDLLTLNWRVSNAGRRCVPSCSTTDHTRSTAQGAWRPPTEYAPAGARSASRVAVSAVPYAHARHVVISGP